MRLTATYLFSLLMVLFTIGGVGYVGAQTYDADGLYTDTVFHDHINRQADDFVSAYYVVAQPGGALYSIFGHACLHLVCPAFGLDYYFSYESEDATQRVLRFFAGNLQMGMMALTAEQYLSAYRSEGRGVVEYELLLPVEVKRELWRVLDEHVAEEALPYDYEQRGCAYACTRLLSEALGDRPIRYAEWPDAFRRTRREICYDYAHTFFPWNMAFIMMMVGTEVDKPLPPEEKLIIPSGLATVWQAAQVAGRPVLSSEPIVVLPEVSSYRRPWCTPLLVACALLVLVLLGWGLKVPYVDWIVLVIATLIGAFVTYLVLFSTLPCTHWNWLIIPFNVLPAVGWHWRRYWALPYAVGCVIWLAGMVLAPHRLADPSCLVLAVAWIVVLLKQVPWQTYKQCCLRRRVRSLTVN